MNIKPTVTAGHDATADAAFEVLKAGGNAVDAAIAGLFASFIAEPCMSSAGGGAFANVCFNGRTHIFDFFCQTPKQKRPLSEVEFFPITVDFGDTTEDFHIGRGSTAVPGMVAGIFELHNAYGTLPMQELVQPAIDFAKKGVAITNFQRLDFGLLEPILRISPESHPIYFGEQGELLPVGAVQKMPEYADFLDYLSREGKRFFYEGDIAQYITADHQENGGYLTLEDFSAYEVIIRKPLTFYFRDKKILTNPLPSTGGALITLLLTLLPPPEKGQTHYSEKTLKNIYTTMKKVSAFGKLPHNLAKALQQTLEKHPKKHGSTTHFNVVDKFGNAVSLTATNGEGCGYYVKNTGIQLNNMLGEEALVPAGFHNWQADTRLSSMMAPTLVLNAENVVEVVTGSGGAGRIPSVIMQVLQGLIDYQLPLELAINKPRVHLANKVFNIEKGWDYLPKQADFEDQLVLFEKKSMFFGGVHTIAYRNGKLEALGDFRREGVSRV